MDLKLHSVELITLQGVQRGAIKWPYSPSRLYASISINFVYVGPYEMDNVRLNLKGHV